MEYKEFSAKTVNDCITDACTSFCVPSDRLDYEVVFEGSNGFMGIGAKPAVIKARIKEENAVGDGVETIENVNEKNAENQKVTEDKKSENKKSEKKSENIANTENDNSKNVETVSSEEKKEVKVISDEEIASMKAAATKFLNEVFAAMDLKVEITCDYSLLEETLIIDLAGDDMGVLIGKRGQTLDSLQYLVNLVVNKGTKEYIRVKVDTENYRERRKETLENLARNIAFKVKRTRRSVSLEPMNPYERRIIHSALQNDKYVTTHSEGEEPYRKVVVTLKK